MIVHFFSISLLVSFLYCSMTCVCTVHPSAWFIMAHNVLKCTVHIKRYATTQCWKLERERQSVIKLPHICICRCKLLSEGCIIPKWVYIYIYIYIYFLFVSTVCGVRVSLKCL